LDDFLIKWIFQNRILIKINKKINWVSNTTKAYQSYQILRLISLVLISLLLVKSSFDRNQTSAFELFLFIANISSFFWTMGISNAILSYYPKLSGIERAKFFTNIFVLLQGIGLIVSFISYFTSGFSLANGNPYIDNHSMMLLAIYIVLYAPTLLVESKYIIDKSSNALLRYGIILYGIQLAAIVIVALLFHSIQSIFIVMVAWIFIKWIWTIRTINLDLNQISPKLIKIFLLFTLPIIAHILLGNGMEFIDGILVEKNFDSSQFSVYRYGAREFPVILILIGALRSVMIPEAVNDIHSTAKKIKNKTTKLILIFFPIAIVLIFISKYLFIYFYNEDYTYSALLFNIYLLIISSRIILSEVFIYAKHKNKTLMYVSFVELVFNIVLSIILMRFYGIAGIAFATFIAFLLSKMFLAFYTQKILGIKLKEYLNIGIYLFFTVLLYIAFWLELWLMTNL